MTGGAADELRTLLAADKYVDFDELAVWADRHGEAVLALIEAAQEMSELQTGPVVDIAEYDDATKALAAAVSRLTEPQT